MKFILFFSDACIPLFLFVILAFAISKKQPVYEDFRKGAVDGFKTVLDIMPTLIGLMVAVGVLRSSGFFDFLANITEGFLNHIHFPVPLFPLTATKMVSSSAATGILLDIYKEYGTDSFIGKAASIMMSSTETIFYTMSLYFHTARVQKSRYTLPGALAATFSGIMASILLARF